VTRVADAPGPNRSGGQDHRIDKAQRVRRDLYIVVKHATRAPTLRPRILSPRGPRRSRPKYGNQKLGRSPCVLLRHTDIFKSPRLDSHHMRSLTSSRAGDSAKGKQQMMHLSSAS